MVRTVAVDLLGSDKRALEVVAGIEIALRRSDGNLRVMPVGPERLIAKLVNEFGDRIVDGRTTMVVSRAKDSLRTVMRKSESSVAMTIKAVADESADAALSFGDTKAAVLWASMNPERGGLGLIEGVLMPPLALTMPAYERGRVIYLDAGANVDCTPQMLVQFAQMGRVLAQVALGIKEPRIGLLSNGEEDSKGNAFVKEAFNVLKSSGFPNLIMVQPTDVVAGLVDVVVVDGFNGNIGFKAIEAGVRLVRESMRRNLKMNWRSKLGYLLAKPALDQVRLELDSSEFGSMPLLGPNGLVMIGHGSADRFAIAKGIESAARFAELKLVEAIRQCMAA